MRLVTVFLNSKSAPGNYDWAVGKVLAHTAAGIQIESVRGDRHFYPSHNIQRVDDRSGW